MADFEFLGRGLKRLFGSRNDRILKQLSPVVGEVNALEPSFEALSDAQLRAKTAEFRARLDAGESLDDILPEAFATVRESSKRTLGMRHFDVQIIGGMILHQGTIAEMTTGEGKTLVCTLAAYLNALKGDGVHVVTVNDYLAKRDALWMRPVFRALDLEVGIIQSQMPPSLRLPAYRADITYGTNSEFGFDYLRDNMKLRLEDQTQQGKHNYAIIDEVDSILIDEARTPLIIAGAAQQSADQYYLADRVVKQLEIDVHFEVNEKDHHVTLTEEGIDLAQELAGVGSFYDPQNIEWPHHIDQSLKANYLYKRDKEYVVDDGDEGPEIVIVDEFTGRKMRGRRWSDGLHQAVEAKEGLSIREENQTLATITYQNFFRQYDKLSGMTGTATTEAPEFSKIYSLEVLVVPTNRKLRRVAEDDLIYRTAEEKFDAVAEEIARVHEQGRPMLVGTTSVEKSERLAGLLEARGIPHELLNAKQHEREAHIVANAGQSKAVTIATNMAGRGTDIILGEGVREMGGLHVIATERHEARRIDNQLRGRAGRQGDPGSSQFFLSLEDDLMRIFAKDWVGTMLQKLGMEDGQEIQSPMVSRMIERVQRKMEAHNFDIRKNLLEYDAVNNEQRKVVYGWRQAILEGDDQSERLGRWVREFCARLAATHLEKKPETEDDRDEDDGPDVAGLSRRFAQLFGDETGITAKSLHGLATKEIIALLGDAAEKSYRDRREEFGVERMEPLERYLLLQTIDDKWKDHLHALDYLRTGVGMRGYGQEDPKIVYRRESADFFRRMIEAVQENVIDLMMRVEPPESAGDLASARPPAPEPQPVALPGSTFDEDSWGEYDDADEIDWDDVERSQADALRQLAEDGEKRRETAAAAAKAAQEKRAEDALRAAGGSLTSTSPGSGPLRRPRHPVAASGARARDAFLTKGGGNVSTKPNEPCPCGSGRKFKKCCGG